MKRSFMTGAAVVALVAAACSGSDADSTTTAAAQSETTTTIAAISTTSATSTTTATTTTTTTTTTTVAPTTSTVVLPDYPISDEWVVETVLAELDAGTGGLSLGPDGNLYSADFGGGGVGGGVVYQVTPAGQVTEFAEPELMGQGTGNVWGPDGRLYQSSFSTGHVLAIAPDGTAEVLTDELLGPTGVAVTPNGRVFVDDCQQAAVFEILPDGSVEQFVRDSFFNCPNGLTIDDDGNLYVVNFNNGRVQRVTPEGEVTEVHNFPGSLAHVAYFDGQLFVTAWQDFLVYRLDLEDGSAEIIAGNGIAGFADGVGIEASFGQPNGITVGPDGTLYINHGLEGGVRPMAIRSIRKVG